MTKFISTFVFLLVLAPTCLYGQSTLSSQHSESTTLNDFINNTDPITKYSLMNDLSLNPCEDEVYLELKKKGINNLSEREFEIFKQKDQACNTYKTTERMNEATASSMENLDKQMDTYNAILIISSIVGLIATVYWLSY